jgi:DNA-binding transcriptional ArsR family regulator
MTSTPSDEPARLRDARVMRALAHPIRLRLIALLSELGTASVRALAGHTGESTASVSYHLSQLARFGLVEEAVEARTGRERPWRAVHRGLTWDWNEGDEASALLRAAYLTERLRVVDEYVAAEPSIPDEWRSAAFFLDDVAHLTAAELAEVSGQIKTLLAGYRGDGRAGARRVTFFAYGLPSAD